MSEVSWAPRASYSPASSCGIYSCWYWMWDDGSEIGKHVQRIRTSPNRSRICQSGQFPWVRWVISYSDFFSLYKVLEGLGLAVVARIIEQLGGQLRVDSKSNEGSTFSFLIPFGLYDPLVRGSSSCSIESRSRKESSTSVSELMCIEAVLQCLKWTFFR